MTETERTLLARRPDLVAVADCIRPGTSVLDLGCGDGLLLRHLRETREARGYGVEIADEKVIACIANGVNVLQGDLERGLADFDSASFDYVILSLTLQAVRHTEDIVREMLRVGREAIVTFPNFGHWSNRWQVIRGRMPVSDELPYQWYDTPNVHLCTVHDFESFCAAHGFRILERRVLNEGRPVRVLPNVRGTVAVFRFQNGH
jgi:methionine biosynthesis protein MetW